MLSLDVCLRCEDDDEGCDGVGSAVGLSTRLALEAIFCMAVSYSDGIYTGYALTTGARLKENLRFTMVDIRCDYIALESGSQ
jgi:hypothetical protein